MSLKIFSAYMLYSKQKFLKKITTLSTNLTLLLSKITIIEAEKRLSLTLFFAYGFNCPEYEL